MKQFLEDLQALIQTVVENPQQQLSALYAAQGVSTTHKTISPTAKTEASEFAPPQTPTEIKLAGIWSEVLNTPPKNIGLHADFFEWGGDSIKAMRLIFLIKKEWGVEIKMGQMFSNAKLSELARLLEVVQIVDENAFGTRIEL